jgi:hypothetical protein
MNSLERCGKMHDGSKVIHALARRLHSMTSGVMM